MEGFIVCRAGGGAFCECHYCKDERARGARKRLDTGRVLTHTRPPRGRKLRVLDRDSWTCYYCGGAATTVDHVVPRSKGGTNAMNNLVAACGPCNLRKGDALPA